MNRANSLFLAAALYAAGIMVISLSPFTGWRFIPELPWAFLSKPWPRYWTLLDLMANILAYIPLGLLASRALSQRLGRNPWGPAWGFLFAVIVGVALSTAMESIQTYLPSRRSSILDLAANGIGCSIGAFLASAYALNKKRLHITESRPTEIGAVMLLGLWLVAQASPQPMWLAMGDLLSGSEEWRSLLAWLSGSAADSDLAMESFAAQRILAESIAVASALLSCALLSHLTLMEAPRWFSGYGPQHWVYAVVGVIVSTVLARVVWILLFQAPDALATWFTAGVQAGIVLALLSAYGLAGMRPSHQRWVALIGVLIILLVANTQPQSGYPSPSSLDWFSGPWLNLQDLANIASVVWPFVALAWLLFVLNRKAMRSLDREIRPFRVGDEG